jgi:hypothetical protein
MSDAHEGGEKPEAAPAAPEETLPPPPPPSPPPPRGSGAAAWATGVLVLVVAIVALAPFWAPPISALLPWGGAPPDAALARLETQLEDADTARSSADARIARLEAALKQQRLPPPAPNPDAAALEALSQRIDTLGRQLETLARATSNASGAASDLAALKDAMQKADARIDALGAQLAATQAASDTKAATLLAAAAALRAALQGSGPYDGELATMTALGQGDPAIEAALAPLAADAATGIPSAPLLALRFRAEVAPAIARASAAAKPAENGGFGDRVLARLKGLVSIRRIGVEDSGGAGIVHEAAAALDRGDLAGAAAALKPLAGDAAASARPFVADLARRIAADRAAADLVRQVAGRVAKATSQGGTR